MFINSRTHRIRLLGILLLCGAVAGPVAAGCVGAATRSAAGFPTSIRGVTISTHRSGQDWGSDRMQPTLEQLRDLGVEWVSIHPYASVRTDGTVRVLRPIDPDDPPDELVRPIREAHALGLKILIKPHLAYWGSFEWRGEIDFQEPAEWERFWRGYRDWIVAVARITRDADGFVVGTELARTLDQEGRWRDLIRDVRAVTETPLTYAANWDRYERVPFWGDLDAIGIQAYFPLVGEAEAPTEAAIRAGWTRWTEALRAFSAEHDRPVLFTELGYNHSSNTAREPWSSKTDENGEALQALCTRIALETVEREEVVIGSFLWKWFPEPHPVGRNFRLATPEMRAVIRDAWSAGEPP